jgi:hypothetical protein
MLLALVTIMPMVAIALRKRRQAASTSIAAQQA